MPEPPSPLPVSKTPKRLNAAIEANERVKAIISAVNLHEEPVYGHRGPRDWRRSILEKLRPTDVVLDVGKSSREFFPLIQERVSRVDTLDINLFDGYPDLICDLCQDIAEEHHGAYDAIICLSVLEALYDPQAGIDNLYRLLKPGGRLFLFAPFIGKYEAPRDMQYQDYFRFTRDGFAYLLRNFQSVDLYAVRGQYSTIAHLLPNWKQWVERSIGHGLNSLLDRLAEPRSRVLQASGYNVIAVK